MTPSGGQSNMAPMVLLPEATELAMTCGACPSQWEGVLADGRSVYVRYRHSRLTVGFGDTLDEAVEASMDRLWCFETEENDGGVMSTETMCELTGIRLAEGVTVRDEDWF